MNTNDFKKNLQADIVSNSNTSNIDELLKVLGLFPVPENMIINISSDNKYICFKLKNSNESQDEHLLFQLPLKEKDLSALRSRDDYQELLDRYHTYINEYIDEVKEYASQESVYLHEKFPSLVFSIKVRIKSYDSYINKINENILAGKTPYINDIMAERVIVTGYKGSEDEELLTQMCYEVAKALYDFRIDTNFRMKSSTSQNTAKTDKAYITKDYIAHPKENGYQSLHLLMQNKYNSDLSYETQIRTFKMESISKNDEKVSHKGYKPRILNEKSEKSIPLYSVITPFNDSSGKPIILDATFKERFYHFYNNVIRPSTNHIEKQPSITYEKYKKELFEITESLGLSFKDIREKLRNIDISKYIKQENSKDCDHSRE